jgi:sulfotransferase
MSLFRPSTRIAVHWSPFFAHIKDGWSRRHDANVLFLCYEDFMADLEGTLRKLADFLEKPLKDEDLPKLLSHLHISNFKHNPAVNQGDLIDVKVLSEGAQGFVRLGDAGKNCELTPEMTRRIDEWIEENLKDSDFRFPI